VSILSIAWWGLASCPVSILGAGDRGVDSDRYAGPTAIGGSVRQRCAAATVRTVDWFLVGLTNDDHEHVGVTVNDRWYFAYGSNLLIDRKVERTGTIRESIRCQLPAHRLAFNKCAAPKPGAYANVVPDESATVWGVAFLCDEVAVATLDSYEGVLGGHYRHEDVEVVTEAGEALRALTYVAGDDYVCEECRPPQDYLRMVLVGARQHGLPGSYIEMIEALGSDAAHLDGPT